MLDSQRRDEADRNRAWVKTLEKASVVPHKIGPAHEDYNRAIEEMIKAKNFSPEILRWRKVKKRFAKLSGSTDGYSYMRRKIAEDMKLEFTSIDYAEFYIEEYHTYNPKKEVPQPSVATEEPFDYLADYLDQLKWFIPTLMVVCLFVFIFTKIF